MDSFVSFSSGVLVTKKTWFGFSVDFSTKNQLITVRHCAVYHALSEVTDYLLLHDADPWIEDENGKIPFQLKSSYIDEKKHISVRGT